MNMKKITSFALALCTSVSIGANALAYNVVDLPETMTMADALGIFSADEIVSATISNLEDDAFITLTDEQIKDFYYASCNIELERTINPTPFRSTAINLQTASDTVSYNLGSGVQIGLYGSDNYVCYKATGEDEIYLTYLDSLYKDSDQKRSGAQLNRVSVHDFLKLPEAQWAVPQIQEAAKNSLLPYELTSKYGQYISREDFCILIGQLITVYTGYADLSGYVQAEKGAYLTNIFADCNGRDASIDMLYNLGIINGRDEHNFDPGGTLTREEAATVVTRAAELFTYINAQNTLSYNDNYLISSWAEYYVRWVTQSGLMTGTDENNFDPKSYYTVEQAVATVNRLLNYLENM